MDSADVAQAERFKVILLTTDGSEFSMGTERVALELAALHGAYLHILHLLLASSGSEEATAEEEETARLMERITEACNQRGVQYTTLVRPAQEPSQGILAVAQEIGADLVVVGRRGRRGLARFKVGDATAKVMEKAECSVLVVPRLVTIWSSGLLLVADSPTSGDRPARIAYGLARASALPLTILMVTDEKESDADRRESNQLVNRWVAMAKLQELEAEGLVETGDMDDAILEAARQRGADLIVCEPRDQSVMERLFRTNTLVNLVGQAHCPVMVVK